MRALTLRQPWAWAVMRGGKDVENRSRNIVGGYRGPVAITAALTYDDAGERHPLVEYAYDLATTVARRAIEKGVSVTGSVIGVVDLVGVHAMWADEDGRCDRCTSPWAQRSPYHLVLANPRPLPEPIPVKGRLGLWTLPEDVSAAVEEALR